ncbi:hypothetical protein N9966_00125 [bacterium]|nr:hypothetical protein [bacterium]
MSNSDYKIKYVAPSKKAALALDAESYIPVRLESKKGLTESDNNVFVINAFDETNIERNQTTKYRIQGKLEIITDNTLQDAYNSLPIPNNAWTPETEGDGLDKKFLPRNWVLKITYPAESNDEVLLSKKGVTINPVTDFVTKAYEGIQIVELEPTNFKPGITNVLIRTAQKHGITSLDDYFYIAPKENYTNLGVPLNSYSGLNRILDFEPGNEEYGLILDTEYVLPINNTDLFGNIQPINFVGVGKRVFEPSSDDVVFLDNVKVTQIQICDSIGEQQGDLIYTKIFSSQHNLRTNDFVEIRTEGFITLGGGNFPDTITTMPNLYKIISTPTPDTFIIKYEFPTINTFTSTEPFNFILNYRYLDGVPSEYYFRINKILTEPREYEVYKAAFSKNIYRDGYLDDVFLFHFDKDIDVGGLLDNLGRPLSQLYLTVIKRAGNGCKGGNVDVEPGDTGYCDGLSYDGFKNMGNNFQILDSNKNFYGDILLADPASLGALSFWQNNDATTAGTFKNSDGSYFNDFVEYNRAFLSERVLSETLGKFGPSQVLKSPNNTITYSTADAYTYKIHQEITIRDFSETIETVENKTNEIFPEYAQINNDGTVSWRDLLSIGFFEPTETSRNGVDYPFVNAKHYLFGDYPIYIRRTLEVDTTQIEVGLSRFRKFNTNSTPNDEC